MGEAEKVERAIAVFPRRRGLAERHQHRLFRMDGQTVARKPLRQHRHKLPGVTLQLTADHKVVGKADQERLSLQARLDLMLEPLIQYLVEVNVRQKRRDHAPLGSALFRIRQTAIFHHTGVEPLPDLARHSSIVYPLVQHFTKWPTRDIVEEPLISASTTQCTFFSSPAP